jgi:ABC-type transporter Mla subunit MlaD
MPNYGRAKLKNHIVGKAPGTLNAMGELFGVSADDFAAAIRGDQEKIQYLADMGRLSEAASANLPRALECARKTIEATGDLNQAYAELIALTQKNGGQVLKSINAATLAEKRFSNELGEMKIEHGNAVTAEETRHTHRTALLQINGATADLLALAKYENDLFNAEMKVPEAQSRAERSYETAVSNALWSMGSDADLSRIHRPNFARTSGFDSISNWFKNIFGI